MAPFSGADLEALATAVAASWRSAADRDWSAPAGTLEWSCAATAVHVVDCVLAPAFFLASRRTDAYPAGGWTPPGDTPPAELAEALETVARITAAVVSGAREDVRAILWGGPEPRVGPPADFAPRAGLELALHAHDIAAGLGVALDVPVDAVGRLRDHVAGWPFWGGYGSWTPLPSTSDPFRDLLVASRRG
jgi:hypothetical protein